MLAEVEECLDGGQVCLGHSGVLSERGTFSFLSNSRQNNPPCYCIPRFSRRVSIQYDLQYERTSDFQ